MNKTLQAVAVEVRTTQETHRMETHSDAQDIAMALEHKGVPFRMFVIFDDGDEKEIPWA